MFDLSLIPIWVLQTFIFSTTSLHHRAKFSKSHVHRPYSTHRVTGSLSLLPAGVRPSITIHSCACVGGLHHEKKRSIVADSPPEAPFSLQRKLCIVHLCFDYDPSLEVKGHILHVYIMSGIKISDVETLEA